MMNSRTSGGSSFYCNSFRLLPNPILYRYRRHPEGIQPPLRSLFLILLGLSTLTCAADIGKYFTKSPSSIVAPPGDRVQFKCLTNVPGDLMVRWKLNGRFLHPANESDIRISGSFLIVKVSKNPERYTKQIGEYQCVVEFGAEALTSLPAHLGIAHMDSFQQRENTTLLVGEGNTVAILCDAPYSNPSPVIQFYKDGKALEMESGNKNLMLMDSGSLHIFNVSIADSGSFWCSVTNHITSDTYVSPSATKLIVEPRAVSKRKPPEFLVKPKSYFVVPKDANATLECVAIGNPPPFVSFRKLRAPTMAKVQSSHGNLHLINAGLSQEGEYICEAYNGVGETVITSLSTVVLNSMPNITKEPQSLTVAEGEEAKLDCAVEGLPKPRVYWVFNGHNVHNDGNIQITDWGLKIQRIEKKHAGLFQCFVVNPMGTVMSPAEVKVLPKQITASAMASDSSDHELPMNSATPAITTRHHHGENHHHKNNKFHNRGKHKRRKHKGQDMIPPSKPSMNRISDESVMIRWSVPQNSGYPIQFFKVQYKEISTSSSWMTIDDDIPPHIHSYEVRDLKPGESYKFRIAAVYSNNDNKVGPNSEKLVMQKDTSMRRPNFVPVVTTAAPHNATTIKLQWKYMRVEGGIDGYFIYYREATTASDYSKVTVLGSDIEVYYITHLKPGTSYDIKIQAFNRAGASNFSSIIAAKTLGVATTEKPDDNELRKKQQTELIIPEDPPPSNKHLYILSGCLFAGFWIFVCLACTLCYKCKQKRAEEEAKYPTPADIEAKSLPNGHHPLNGYLPTITSHLDEKETSFVERHCNNNRPISPSQLNSTTCEDLTSSFKGLSLSLERNSNGCLEMKTNLNSGNTLSRKDSEASNNSRNNSLSSRKKHQHLSQSQNNSLRRGPYQVVSSNEDLDNCTNTNTPSDSVKNTKIFPKEYPKEHYKHRKHSRKRNSMVDG